MVASDKTDCVDTVIEYYEGDLEKISWLTYLSDSMDTKLFHDYRIYQKLTILKCSDLPILWTICTHGFREASLLRYGKDPTRRKQRPTFRAQYAFRRMWHMALLVEVFAPC